MIRIRRGKLRVLLVIFAVLFMSYDARLFTSGVIVFMVGLLLHFISKGYLFRNLELAIRGPYSFTRHPFYISNMILDVGIILMSGHPVVLLIYLPLYYICYHKVILGEELNMINVYGDLYRRYMNAVPRYFPKVIPYVKDWYKGFKWKNILREREFSRLLRLITYPISFLIIHDIRVYGLGRVREVLPWLSVVVLLLWSSYLFHNIVEWDRRFRNVSWRVINLCFLGYILFIGLVLNTVPLTLALSDPRFGTGAPGRGMDDGVHILTVFFLLAGTLLLNARIYSMSLLGDVFFSLALCIYSRLYWMVPFSLLGIVFVIVYNQRRQLRKEALVLPSRIRILLYIFVFISLWYK